MSLTTLANRVTATFGRQILTAQKHSPTALVVIGVVGMGTTVVLACRATLKLSDALEKGEEHLQHVEVTVTEGDEVKKEAGFNVRLQTAIKIARLYAPAIVIGTASLAALTCSHVILQKRNMAALATFAAVDRSFRQYRDRVVEDQGREKDFEYRFGTEERQIAEEGDTGTEVVTVKGPSQKSIEDEINNGSTFARLFAPTLADGSKNSNWSDVPHQNEYFLQMVERNATNSLRRNGWISLNKVYALLGFPETKMGQLVGWSYNPKRNPQTGEIENDREVDFGAWKNGMYVGKQWVDGNKDAILLDFNVDPGTILDDIEEC